MDTKLKISLSCRKPSVTFRSSVSQKWSHQIGSLGDPVSNLLKHFLHQDMPWHEGWWGNQVLAMGVNGNEQDDCSSHDSRIGSGEGGSRYENTCGNRALWSADKRDKNIKEFGYIFIQRRHWTTLLKENTTCDIKRWLCYNFSIGDFKMWVFALAIKWKENKSVLMNQNHVSLCNVVTQRKSVFLGRFVTFTIKSGH